MPTIDLNADLGEGVGDDDALLTLVTSANVACGFHAGDAEMARRTVRGAVRGGVSVGAHPSYRDRAHFGRRPLDLSPARLADDITEQLAFLDAIASAAGGRVAYVKPHGALYNRIVADEEQAAAVVQAVVSYAPGLAVLGLPGSAFLRLAAGAGLLPVGETFADRAYRPDGTLVPRSEPGAVLHDPDAVVAQTVALARAGAASLCVHGDTPGAVVLARRVRDALVADGFVLAPFAP